MVKTAKDDNPSGVSHPERNAGNFYGRRKAKPLKGRQEEALQSVLPALRLDLSVPCEQSLAACFDHAPEQIYLEIGFGAGEHLIQRAENNPQCGFIGCEPFINGMAKAVREIDDRGLTNIRLFDEDATLLLDWLPDASLDGIDLFYPDPWHKKRHWKRRFVNTTNLKSFHRILKPMRCFRFASDIESYVNWTMRHVFAHGGFDWTAREADDWRKPWPEWVSTRYEQKAIREGRTPAYFIFQTR